MLVILEENPRADAGDEEVRVRATLHGGNGSLKQGAMRRLVVRFELGEGLHIYGDPVPEGMLPTRVEVSGPEGIVFEDPVYPPTTPLRLEAAGLTLPVWSGTVDVQIPVYALSRFVSECHPVDQESATLEVTVRYQACDDAVCTNDCEPGEQRDADDGCNACACTSNHTWACTDMECPSPDCEPGAIRVGDDGCSDCVCDPNGSWQ